MTDFATHAMQFVQTGDLQSLSGSKIAIDVDHFLTPYREELKTTEPFYQLTGGIPNTLFGYLQSQGETLSAARLIPLFMFHGLSQQEPKADLSVPQALQQSREVQWAHAANARHTFNPEPFNTAFGEDVEGAILSKLVQMSFEAHRAPYLAWGQMSALLTPNAQYVTDVFGPPELLVLENVERVIVSFDFASKSFKYIPKTALVQSYQEILGRPPRPVDLVDICVLSSQHKFLKDLHSDRLTMTVQEVAGRVSQGRIVDNIMGIYSHNSYEGQEEAKRVLRARCIIRHAVALAADGECLSVVAVAQQAQAANQQRIMVPANLVDIYGPRLPPVFYYLHFIGMLSTSVMTVVVHALLCDTAPLVDSREYRSVLERIIPLRTQIVYQLLQYLASLSEYFSQGVNIIWSRWFHVRGIPVLRPPPIRLDDWLVTGIDANRISFSSVLQFAGLARKQAYYTTPEEAHAAILLKSLDLLGYFTHATHSDSHEVSGTSVYSEALQDVDPEFCDEGVLLIELLRTKSLVATNFTYEVNNPHSQPPETDGATRVVNFAARMMSALTLNFKGGWNGPVSKNLLAFNTVMKSLQRTLRSLIEVVATTLYLESCNKCKVDTYITLVPKLPFGKVPTTHMAMVMEHLMRTEDLGTSPANCIARLKEKFPGTSSLEEDLKRAFRFFDQMHKMLNVLHTRDNDTIPADMFDLVVQAKAIIDKRRATLAL